MTSRKLSEEPKEFLRQLLAIIPGEILETEDAAETLTTPAAAPSASGVYVSQTEFLGIPPDSSGSGP